jgi:hypothetical protein
MGSTRIGTTGRGWRRNKDDGTMGTNSTTPPCCETARGGGNSGSDDDRSDDDRSGSKTAKGTTTTTIATGTTAAVSTPSPRFAMGWDFLFVLLFLFSVSPSHK